MQEKQIFIAGGSGFIGSYLTERLLGEGYKVLVVSRSGLDVPWELERLTEELNRSEVLINLAGSSINTRFTNSNREKILHSRIKTTELLHQAIAQCATPPKLWINASATGIYKHTFGDDVLDETSQQFANDFLGDVTKAWEMAFFANNLPHTRRVALRTSVVLGKSGGAFSRFRLLSSLGLGGKQGDGKQMISWIHIEDYLQIILQLISNVSIDGVLNAAAPFPVSNKVFMKILRQVNGVAFGLPAPAWMLRLAMPIVGIDASLVLGSTNVRSTVLEKHDFQFKYPSVTLAFKQLLSK